MFLTLKGKGLNDGWRYVLGFFIVIVCWQILGGVPILGLWAYLVKEGELHSGNIIEMSYSVGISQNIVLILMLSSFVFGLFSLFLVNRFLHKRSGMIMITSRKNFSWERAVLSFSLWIFFSVILFAIDYSLEPENYTFSFVPEKFIPLVIISVLLLPIQIGFEELFLRGYFSQGLAMVSGSRLLAFIVPAVLFGLLHIFNPEISEYGFGVMMIYYIGTGLFLGLIAIMDEGLEITLGFHLANNLMGALLFRMEESALKTDSLFVVRNSNPADDIVPYMIVMIIFVLIVAKVFKWENWKKLYTNQSN